MLYTFPRLVGHPPQVARISTWQMKQDILGKWSYSLEEFPSLFTTIWGDQPTVWSLWNYLKNTLISGYFGRIRFLISKITQLFEKKSPHQEVMEVSKDFDGFLGNPTCFKSSYTLKGCCDKWAAIAKPASVPPEPAATTKWSLASRGNLPGLLSKMVISQTKKTPGWLRSKVIQIVMTQDGMNTYDMINYIRYWNNYRPNRLYFNKLKATNSI